MYLGGRLYFLGSWPHTRYTNDPGSARYYADLRSIHPSRDSDGGMLTLRRLGTAELCMYCRIPAAAKREEAVRASKGCNGRDVVFTLKRCAVQCIPVSPFSYQGVSPAKRFDLVTAFRSPAFLTDEGMTLAHYECRVSQRV